MVGRLKVGDKFEVVSEVSFLDFYMSGWLEMQPGWSLEIDSESDSGTFVCHLFTQSSQRDVLLASMQLEAALSEGSMRRFHCQESAGKPQNNDGRKVCFDPECCGVVKEIRIIRKVYGYCSKCGR